MIKKLKHSNLSREENIIKKRNELSKEKVAAIWTRVSSADQFKNNCSIETQLESCRAYCAKNGIRVKKEFGGKNESAKVAGDLFMDMIGEVLNDPEYNQIVVFDFDRFSRNSTDGIVYKAKVARCGISVKSVNQPIDSNNVLAEQIENILIIIAEIENAMRRHKCHEGMVNCINRGEWYSKPPLGYTSKKVDRHHFINVNKEGKILRHAFEWILNEPGISQFEILRRLKSEGLELSKQRLSSILRNSFYCGRVKHKYLNTEGKSEKYIKGVQEPLISEEMFENVQKILEGNHGKYEQVSETPKFPLKGYVFCAKDSHLLTGYTTKGNDYYKCSVKGCKTNVKADKLHELYADSLKRYSLPEVIIPLFKEVLQNKFMEKERIDFDIISNTKKNLETVKTKLKTVKRRYALGEIEKDVYDEVSSDLKQNCTLLEKEIQFSEECSSNLSEYITQSIEIASKLGSYWKKIDFKICQKIQKLTFPNGIKWDGNNKCFRTDGENEYLAKIASIGTWVGGCIKEERDKSCDLSRLVAGRGLEPLTSGL